ncbi:cobalt ECF transporter T component CbiQ [Brevibacillus laterosporus]|uniref:cobalt ECF transporter T component CbiQ n=1 Tax=Brevibacillus laterosporus TaxID=1465 RepID=UPI00037B8409|nr:cobalt ECF transporter T component CbiQ [Brevibacillus laterosporus]ATO50520.1 cobalt ECF transporter T component CbiQ [Brevibacillus laterosporus DSM 25]MBG9802594.1 cobalt ABC transporter permease [Brevibacillus laterosporus]MED2005147.1 cobalt ECF transporter T component CbiQ [Brevibacillus laterosporus]MED4766076.1 cobalt ECF transporter T component CbiQ [Brevibacillus laterosporus]TPH20415.1 cobalt ECF transporter T component CbiQ [Brevibacillus laterosporus]
MNLWIDRIAYQNRLRDVSARFKAGFAAGMLVLALCADMEIQIAIFIWMSIWIVGYASVPLRSYLIFIGVACLFFISSTPALLIDVQHLSGSANIGLEASWHLITIGDWYVFIDQRNLFVIAKLFSRTLGASACFAFLLLTTPLVQLLDVLRALRVPPIIVELIMLMYRFLFVFFQTAHDLWIAQKARGGHGSFSAQLKDMGRLVSLLFAKSMQRYQQLTYGLLARGFDGDLRVVHMEKEVYVKRYLIEATIGGACCVALIFWHSLL